MIRLAACWDVTGRAVRSVADPVQPMLDMMNRHQASGFIQRLQPSGNCTGGLLGSVDLQPYFYEHKKSGVQILFDGAIYNQEEVCKKLGINPGNPGGEAALLFHLYREWGEAGLQELEGRWAFVLADPAEGLWAARDRFGVKPLYYAQMDPYLFFASEQKAFLALEDFRVKLSPAAVFDFFVRHRSGTDESDMFQGINQLMPGTSIRVRRNENRVIRSRWYKLRSLATITAYKESKSTEYQGLISDRLQDNISRRLKRHPAAASFLSGGLDSSLLSGILSREQQLKVLSAIYPGQKIDEGEWARRVVDHLGTDWHTIQPDISTLRSQWEDFYFSQDLPTFSFGTFNQFLLFQKARELKIPSVFDGQAADALFAGHDYFLPAFWNDLRRTGQWKALRAETRAYGNRFQSWKYFLRNYTKYAWMPGRSAGFQMAFRQYIEPGLSDFLRLDFLRQYRDRLLLDRGGDFSLNPMLKQEFVQGEVLGLLKCLDRAGSWSGVDPVTPFADDHKLVEMLFAIPGVYKIHQGQTKYLLRRIARQYIPASVAERSDKKGLVAPTNSWIVQLHEEMRPLFRTPGSINFRPRAHPQIL